MSVLFRGVRAYVGKRTRGRRLEIALGLLALVLAAWILLAYSQPRNRIENRGYVAFPDSICPGDTLDKLTAYTWVNTPLWIELGHGSVTSNWENLPGETRATSESQTFSVDYTKLTPGMNKAPSPLLRTAPLTPGDYVMVNKRTYTWTAYGIRRTTSDAWTTEERVLTVVPYGSMNPQPEERVTRPFCD